MIRRSNFLPVIVFVVAIMAAMVGLGFSYPARTINGHQASALGRDYATGWYSDGWVVDGATLQFPYLATPGNTVAIALKAWRPGGEGPANLRITSCGENVAQFSVTSDIIVRVKAKSSCDDNRFVIAVENPFVPSLSDSRQLGVQISNISVSSIFGFPLVAPFLVLLGGLFLAVPGILFLVLWSKTRSEIGAAFFGVITPLVGALALSQASWIHDRVNLLCGWLVLTLLILGGAIGVVMPRVREFFKVRASPIRSSIPVGLVLLLVVALGAVLRLYGITFGLPAPFHPDETPKFNAITGMMTRGDMHPHYFLHPSLLLYLTYGLNAVIVGLGAVFPALAWEPAATVRLSGRLVSATAGTLSIPILYFIGVRLFSKRVGLLAATFLAVFPLHVTCSRYMKEDVLMTLFVLCAVWCVTKAAQESPKRSATWSMLLAGVFGGLACGTKYSGALILPAIAATPWLVSRSWVPDGRLFRIGIFAGVLCVITFICTTPYSVLDSREFLMGVASEQRHAMRGHTVPIDAWSQWWMYHVWRSLAPGTGLLPLVFAVIGLGVMLVRRRVEDLWIVGLFLLFYVPAEWVRSKPAPQAERYMVPVVPFLALAAAQLLVALRASPLLRLTPVIVGVTFFLPLLKTGLLATELLDDSRSRLDAWIHTNIPKGARIAIDYPPYDPPLLGGTYQVLRFAPGQLLNEIAEGRIQEKADYLVLSSLIYDRFFTQPNGDGARREVIRQAFSSLPVLQQMRPRYLTYGFHNPVVTIFDLKSGRILSNQAKLDLQDDPTLRASIRRTALQVP